MVGVDAPVDEHLGAKRASMAAHGSQIGEASVFLTLPDEAFAATFGMEWFSRRDVPDGHREDDLFAGLPG